MLEALARARLRQAERSVARWRRIEADVLGALERAEATMASTTSRTRCSSRRSRGFGACGPRRGSAAAWRNLKKAPPSRRGKGR